MPSWVGLPRLVSKIASCKTCCRMMGLIGQEKLYICIAAYSDMHNYLGKIGLHAAVANFRMQKSQVLKVWEGSILRPLALLRRQALTSSRVESNKLSPFAFHH